MRVTRRMKTVSALVIFIVLLCFCVVQLHMYWSIPQHGVQHRPKQHREGCVVLWRGQSAHHQDTGGSLCLTREELVQLEAENEALQHEDQNSTALDPECIRPVVAWDAPLSGGLTAGLANEAVSYLVPLSSRIRVVLASSYREDSSFVASLAPEERHVVQKLKVVSDAHVYAEPSIYFSQWAPGDLFSRNMEKFPHKNTAYRISRAMYEATRVPNDWLANLPRLDEIWVPSEWNRQILLKEYGLSPQQVKVVIQGLNTRDPFNPALFDRAVSRKRIYPANTEAHFIFLSIFKWEERKAYKELIQAFGEEFSPNEPVSLILRTKPTNSWGYGEIDIKTVIQQALGRPHENIRVLGNQEDHRYHQMLVGADAFVLATHGEGWGRPIMEAMAMELPVIAANWSGPTQFVTPSTGYLLPVDELEVASGLPGADKSAMWAKIDVKRLRELLRYIYTHQDEARAVGKRARKHIVSNYDQDKIAEDVLARFQRACTKQKHHKFPRYEYSKKKISPPSPPSPQFQHREQQLSSDWIWKWGKKG